MLPTSPSYPTATPPPDRLVWRFMTVAAALLLLWFFGYEQWLAVDGRLDQALCSQIAAGSAFSLRLLGFRAQANAGDAQLLNLDGWPAVHVGPPCNGLVLYALFAGFVLAYPGSFRRRLWFIPLGLASLYLLNVLRVAALALNHHYAPRSLDFNHHYTFNIVVYSVIFGLWMWWVRQPVPSAATPAGPAAGGSSH